MKCGEMLRAAGYKVRVFNTIEMEHSNNYNPFHYVFDEKGQVSEVKVKKMINVLFESTKGDGEKDDMWQQKGRTVIEAIVFLLFEESEYHAQRDENGLIIPETRDETHLNFFSVTEKMRKLQYLPHGSQLPDGFFLTPNEGESEAECQLRSKVRVGRELVNIYSKTYAVPDVNYSALPREEQEIMIQRYVNLLNGFDSMASMQVTLINTAINREDFEQRILLQDKNDGMDGERHEFNHILHDRMQEGLHGRHCRIFLTVTVAAVSLDAANQHFYALEGSITRCLGQLGTEAIALNANARVRLLADIFCDVNMDLSPVSRTEFARQAEKHLCCPDYFEFKRDYFMFNDKYARCIYFRRLAQNSGQDTIFGDLIATNQDIIITKNVDFVEQEAAIRMIERKLTDMTQEQIEKVRRSARASNGAFVDPLDGTQIMTDKEEAKSVLERLKGEEKMTLCQFILMLTADSYEELQQNTAEIETILRGYRITPSKANYRQEIALSSVLPIGNSMGIDKERNLQVRRTLYSESTAIFIPFISRVLQHEGGIFYGLNRLSRSPILFDRKLQDNANGFLFGVPGSGKSMFAKLEMLFSMLATNDEILVLDPEGEYTALAELIGGEVIYISENAKTYINPMDLTENPDKEDTTYNPIKAKLDFLLSFFSCIMGNKEITPIQKTIIDNVMHQTYRDHKKPTLTDYYDELKKYEDAASDEDRSSAQYLRQALHLYVHGSMNVFAHETNVDQHKRFVVYNIKELGKNLETLGMMIVLENLWDRVAKNRVRNVGTRIYVDEMYLLFKSEHSANFFYELYKRARKWGGTPTGITQNVDDLLRSQTARTMISNTEFVIMLSQNPADQEQLSQLLRIPMETMKYVDNAASGCGLIHTKKFGDIPFDHTIPVESRIYPIISTRFAEKLPEN